MIRVFRASLCAAAALCAASPAAAATYVSYDISGLANYSNYTTSQTTTFLNGVGTYAARFVFAVADIRSSRGFEYYEAIDSSSFGPNGVTSLGATAQGIDFFRRATNRALSTVNISACLQSPSASLPTTTGAVALASGCSSVRMNIQNEYFLDVTSGTVDRFAITAFDAPAGQATGLTSFVFTVPEPATWALMLAGFGMVGYAMRRRRSAHTVLA